jgi:hypothetical protein
MKGNFLHRRYAICLGRRYAIAAAGLIFLGTCSGYGDSFQRQGQFLHMGNKLSISEVTPKTFVEVNQEETDANR